MHKLDTPDNGITEGAGHPSLLLHVFRGQPPALPLALRWLRTGSHNRCSRDKDSLHILSRIHCISGQLAVTRVGGRACQPETSTWGSPCFQPELRPQCLSTATGRCSGVDRLLTDAATWPGVVCRAHQIPFPCLIRVYARYRDRYIGWPCPMGLLTMRHIVIQESIERSAAVEPSNSGSLETWSRHRRGV